jgi:1-acyl-sn-glycerol-3-phosphate acyltransferase
MSARQTRHKAIPKSTTLKFVSAMQRRLFDYEFLGLKNLDKDKPSILVGNHSIYAWDVAIICELKCKRHHCIG